MTHRLIGKEIAKKRKKVGISQIDFASKIGLSLAQVKFVEGGRKKIDITLMKKIKEVIGEFETPSDKQNAA